MSSLEERVRVAAEAALADGNAVAPLDVLCRIGWLTGNHIDHWRRGRTTHLPPLSAVRDENLVLALATLMTWAETKGLQPSEVPYVSGTRDRRPLRFLEGATEDSERIFRIHWLSMALSAPQREQVATRAAKAPELVVVAPLKEWSCAGCGGTDDFLLMEDAGPMCMTCVDFGHLVFLPRGDATLTRRARQASGLAAVVVQWSRSRKRYERQGLLVEEAAVEQAEASCLADEDVRARQRDRAAQRRDVADIELTARMADEIARLFPGCPSVRAQAIAAHTAQRGSGRVGRSAAGRALDEDALVAAAVASIRHEDTRYDELLMDGVDRAAARVRVRADVDAVLVRWRRG